MILSDLVEVMEKRKLSKEEAIMTVLIDWAASNGLIMTAIVSFQKEGLWAISTVATVPNTSPTELLKTFDELHSDMIEKIIKNQEARNG